jgi:5-methylcytosine-specific restriction endonuclease McrA
VTPVVVGNVNPAAFGDLIKLCAQLDELLHGPADDQTDDDQPGDSQPGEDQPGDSGPVEAGAADAPAGSARSQDALVQAILGKAVELLSGPGGLASYLRRHLGLRAGGPSLPLDIGYSETIPASIRNAVRLRDRHCQWAGRCSQPASACQVHHTKHKANGGKTSLKDCVLLCAYHHQVMIHRRGWTLVVNSDGTTTAWNKDKTKVLHSHGPPARAG